MLLKKSAFLWLLTLLTCRAALAQTSDINFTAITVKEGLSSNTVNTIVKDRYGFLWFGTQDGLNKFDGINLTVYRQKPGDSTALPANEILSLHEDRKGNLWVGSSGGALSLYDRKKDAFVNFPAKRAPGFIGNEVVRSICSDAENNLWIAHYRGVNVRNAATGQISDMVVSTPEGLQNFSRQATCIFADSRRRIWIGTTDGLVLYYPEKKTITQFVHAVDDPGSLANNIVRTIAEDRQGHIWVGTETGLSRLLPGAAGFINYLISPTAFIKAAPATTSISFNGNRVWVCTSHGLAILNPATGSLDWHQMDYRNQHSVNAKEILTSFADSQGILWLGTKGGGVNKYDKNLNLFNYVQSNMFDPQGLNVPSVISFAEHANGNVYVGTDGGGLRLFDRQTGLFTPVPLKSARPGSEGRLAVLSLAINHKNELMAGTYAEGLFILNPATGQSRQLLKGPGPNELNANDIYSILEDSKGQVWLGTNGGGINVVNKDYQVTHRFTPDPKAPNDRLLPVNGYIRALLETSDGRIWIATHGSGLAVLQPANGTFTVYSPENGGLPNAMVLSILEDRHKNVWVGTRSGLTLFPKTGGPTFSFSEKDGLQNSTIYTILEDHQGLIWVSTNKGISSLDPATKKIANYNHHNGVQNSNFNRGAGLRTSNGDLFFGGLEGFNYFHPSKNKTNRNIPSLVLTDLRISNQSVTASENGPITEHISTAGEIHLDYKQNFALSFAGLSYTSPEQNQYAYQLEGFEKDWNYVGNTTSAAYTNLDPGQYTFRVKASNNDGIWNQEGTSIKIYVHPPFWLTVYAYVFYALLAIGLVFYIRYRSLQKLRREFALQEEKAKAEQERQEAARLRELDRLKIKFLTNLSHEFRTPISLILGPLEKLLTQEKNSPASPHLSLVRRNARRLLNLVNQLLDFRKMEEHELSLQESPGELVSFIKEASDSFKDLAEQKKIDFVFTSQLLQLPTRFDHDKLERILFNLLSNAFKFSLEGGQIRLDLAKRDRIGNTAATWVSIRVTDTGIGIPAAEKDKIFEHFFQHKTASSILNQGTGIGLSITKEFVRMYGGTIAVESEPGKGTTFTVDLPFLPVAEAAAVVSALPEPAPIMPAAIEATEETEQPGEQTDLPMILLVEDSDDFRFYLKDNLRQQYKVIEAANGKEGWQKALALHPMLIVSDVNMPHMDGIELTRKLKADKRTGHIPVILLTAVTGEADQLKGLGTGANDYITKPFSVDVLNAKIKNLLHLKTTFKNTYSKQINVLAPEVTVESGDEKLLQEIMRYLDENMTEAQLSVENLSQHLGMSRSYFYKKLLDITGKTPVEFIRSVKLERAALLLEKSDMNISQVCYSAGFATPNYFTKAFKAKYNMLPSEYMQQKRKGPAKNVAE